MKHFPLHIIHTIPGSLIASESGFGTSTTTTVR